MKLYFNVFLIPLLSVVIIDTFGAVIKQVHIDYKRMVSAMRVSPIDSHETIDAYCRRSFKTIDFCGLDKQLNVDECLAVDDRSVIEIKSQEIVKNGLAHCKSIVSNLLMSGSAEDEQKTYTMLHRLGVDLLFDHKADISTKGMIVFSNTA